MGRIRVRKSFLCKLSGSLILAFFLCFLSNASMEHELKQTFVAGYSTGGNTSSSRNNGGISNATEQGDTPMARIVNPHPFSYTINQRRCNDDAFLMVYVYSAPNHFDERMAIRRSWGNVSLYDTAATVTVRIVFVLGLTVSPLHTRAIHTESQTYTDIVQEDFLDSYDNLTCKGVAAMKWVVKNCDSAKFVMKVDDDVVVNLFRWIDMLQKDYGGNQNGLILCNVYRNAPVQRDGKWRVDKNTWMYDTYPTYCDGRAYTMSMDVLTNMYTMSHYTRFFWIEDIYFTGILPSVIGDITHIDHTNQYAIHGKFQSAAEHIFVDVLSRKPVERASVWKKMLTFEASHGNNTKLLKMLPKLHR